MAYHTVQILLNMAIFLGYIMLKTGSVWLVAFGHTMINSGYQWLTLTVNTPNDPRPKSKKTVTFQVTVFFAENSVIKNILWDLDGTFFDTYPAITYAVSKSLNEMGCSIALNVIDGLVRQSIDHCVETLCQRFKLDPELLRARFAESYRTIDPANQPPFPGVREVCEAIHTLHGLNVIVTHRSVQSAQRLLRAHNFSTLIDDIFSVEQGYPRKPDPSMLLATLEKHNLNPGETLLIGDRDIDIQAGQAAGVRTCLFGQAELTTSSDLQINAYGQLLEMLIAQ